MAKRAFIFTDKKSSKFWWIEYDGLDFVLNYGKTGTNGQFQVKEFDSEEECCKTAEKLIDEKIKKGYKEDLSFDFDSRFYFDDEEIGLHSKTSHPNFRAYFSDDLYYDCLDEEAPFGSDEGNDTLDNMQDIVRKKGVINFSQFPQTLIEKTWDMKYIQPEWLNEDSLKELIADDDTEMNMTQSDMVTSSSAFAQIKITGSVDKDLKERAIVSLKRSDLIAKLQGWNVGGEDSKVTKILIDDLSSFNKYR